MRELPALAARGTSRSGAARVDQKAPAAATDRCSGAEHTGIGSKTSAAGVFAELEGAEIARSKPLSASASSRS